MSCHCHCHVTAAGSLIVCIDYFAIFENTDSRGAAAYINYSTICDLKYSRCSGWFIYDIRNLKASALQHILDAFGTSLRDSGWNGCCRIRKLYICY